MGGMDPPAVAAAIAVNNLLYSHYVLIALGVIVTSIFIYRIAIHSVQYIRNLTCLNNENQRYFKLSNPTFDWIKRHLLYAPLFRRRHQKQLRIGAVDMGILPTRFQSLLLVGIITMNVVLCAYGIEWDGAIITKLKHLRNRSGTLAVVNMIPLVIMAGRNNPLIPWLNISYDTFNLMHRWFGRIVVALAVTHGTVEIMSIVIGGQNTHTPGWESFSTTLKETRFITFGFVALVAMCTIILTSWTAFRHAFYETFWHVHIALVSLILAALWIHLHGLQQMNYLKAVIYIWVVERLIRLSSLIYRNVGRSATKADVEILPGDAMRITLRPARPWTFKPGQHVFLTIPSVGLWTSHPFSIAWSDGLPQPLGPHDIEKGVHTSSTPAPTIDTLALPQNAVSLIIRRRTGFTDHLYRKALNGPNNHRISLPALTEGPYGGSSSSTQALHSYGTVMLFAAGVGITHQLPLIRDLLAGHAAGTVAARRVCLIWIVRSPEHVEWVRPWINVVLSMPSSCRRNNNNSVLRIKLFITRPKGMEEEKENGIPTTGELGTCSSVRVFVGKKPDVEALVERESRGQVGAMGVGVCGPGGLGDEVRGAVRRVLAGGGGGGGGNVDFWEEGFGW